MIQDSFLEVDGHTSALHELAGVIDDALSLVVKDVLRNVRQQRNNGPEKQR
jgi:hypothetical protein